MLAYTIISLADVLSRFGLDNAAVRYVSLYHGEGNRDGVASAVRFTLFAGLFTGVVVGAGLYFSADKFFAEFFAQDGLGQVLRLLAVSVPFLSVMTVALASTQGLKEMKYTAWCKNIFHPVANLCLVLLFYAFGSKLVGVASAWLLSTFISVVLSLYYLQKVLKHAGHRGLGFHVSDSAATAREILGFASPLVLVVILTSLITWTDTLMLGYFRPADEVGIYSAALRTAMLTGIVLVSFNAIFSPLISDLYNRGETGRLESMFKLTCRWIFTFSLPLFLLISLFPAEIMSLFGAEFVSGQNVLVVIAFAWFINAAAGSVGVMLIMSGYQKVMMVNSIAIFLLNVLMNYFLIPAYGMQGAAVASGLSIIAYNAVMLLQVKILIGMHPYNRMFIKPLVFGGIIFLIFYMMVGWLDLSLVLKLTVIAPAFVGAFLLAIFFRGAGEEDKVVIESVLEKLKRGAG